MDMDTRDELTHLPESIHTPLMATGRRERHVAGSWLENAPPVPIRLIETGSVRIFAQSGAEWLPVFRYGAGELLGVRALLRPDSEPKLAWRVETELETLAFDAEFIRTQMAGGRELRQLLEHCAHLRDLEILMAVHPLFRRLPEELRGRMLAEAESRVVAPGETLLRRDHPGDTLFLVTDGRLDLTRDGKTIDTRRRGDIVGVTTMTGVRMPVADAVAGSWTDVLAFPFETVLAASREHPAFSGKLLAIAREHAATYA